MIPPKYWSPTKKLMVLGAMAGGKTVEATALGNPLTFITDVSKPLRSLLIPFTPQQSGTGDPSPQNIRSILPWDGLKVFGGGKNLFDVSTVVNGTLDGTGALVENNNRRTSTFITLTAGKYKLSRNALVDWWKAWSYKLDGTPISKLFDGNGYEVTITITETCKIRISFDYIVDVENEVQLEAGQTATAYEPYKPITETDISFPSPVYGGTLDVVSGVLTVEWEIRSMKSMTWWVFGGDLFQANPKKDKYTQIMCDSFPVVLGNPSADMTIGSYTNGANYAETIILKKEGMTSGAEFNTWLSGLDYDPMIAYKTQTPVEIQMTPAQLTALVGNNTIWSDADGQMTAVYLKKK